MKNFTKTKMKHMVAMGLPLALMGCNTVEGVGTDIGYAGHALEHAAKDAKEPCPPPCPPRTQVR